MAGLQDQVAALPERLIDGLSYDNIGNTANYVLDCDQATLFPASDNTFSSTGIRVIRINIASNLWMVPDTARLCCSIKATTHPLKPVGPMSLLFSRVRILAGGVVLAPFLRECPTHDLRPCAPRSRTGRAEGARS